MRDAEGNCTSVRGLTQLPHSAEKDLEMGQTAPFKGRITLIGTATALNRTKTEREKHGEDNIAPPKAGK